MIDTTAGRNQLDEVNDAPTAIVSGRSETGILIAYVFASLGYRVISVEKQIRGSNWSIYTLRDATLHALEAVAEGLGENVRKQCCDISDWPLTRPTAAKAPQTGVDVGQSFHRWVIRADRLYETIAAYLNDRPPQGSIEHVEGTLTPIFEGDKTTWEAIQRDEHRTANVPLLQGMAPSVVCTVEGYHGTTLQSLGVEKIYTSRPEWWIIGVVEGGGLGREAELELSKIASMDRITRKVSRLSDGRGSTAIHVHISEVSKPEVSQDDIERLFERALVDIYKLQHASIAGLDIRGPDGLPGSRPRVVRVQGKAARQASFLHRETVMAGFGDDIGATSFQTGGGINIAIAETGLAIELATELSSKSEEEELVERLNKKQQLVGRLNEKLLGFSNYFSASGAPKFYTEIGFDGLAADSRRLIQAIYGTLLQQWQIGCPPPDFEAIERKLSFILGRPDLVEQTVKRSLEFPGDGTFKIGKA